MGTLSKLRRMVLRENVSVREAARRLRISRNTAKRWLSEPDMVEPVYHMRGKHAVNPSCRWQQYLGAWCPLQ